MTKIIPEYSQQRIGNVLYCQSITRLDKVVTMVPQSPYEALTIWTTIALHDASMFVESESYEALLATQRARLQLKLYVLNAINRMYILALPSPHSYSNMSLSEVVIQPLPITQTQQTEI